MSNSKKQSSRRAFFLHGGAALSAGIATTAAAAALPRGASPADELLQLRQRLADAAERDAIVKLQTLFTTLMTERSYEAAAALFADQATLQLSGETAVGRPAIRRLFTERYLGQEAAVIPAAYRVQHTPEVSLDASRLAASATIPVEVELSTPLRVDCTAAEMARLQGQMASCRWEAGRFEATFAKTRDRWQITRLIYSA